MKRMQSTLTDHNKRGSWSQVTERVITSGWQGIVYVIMVAWSLVSLFCFGWILVSSLKTNQELFANVWALPRVAQWGNYLSAWRKSRMSGYILNSVIVSAFSVGLTGLIASMASYILARFRFRGNRPLLVAFIAGLAIPLQLILVPVYLMFSRLNLTNSLPALAAMYVTISLPFSIFVLTGFFRSLPRELEEAAVLDGASEHQLFWRVMLPLVRPGLVTISIFNFLSIWNEYTLALFLLSDAEKMTVPVGLYNLKTSQGYVGDWVSMFAGLVIVLLPTVLVFLVLQRRIMGGMTLGALKG